MDDRHPKFSLDQYILYVDKLNSNAKGDVFELSSLYYFQEYHPGYQYYPYKDFLLKNKEYFGLPKTDKGVDIVGLDVANKKFLLIQCKYKGCKYVNVSYGSDKISNLISCAKVAGERRKDWKIHQFVITTGKKVTDFDPVTIAITGQDLNNKIRLNFDHFSQYSPEKKQKKKELRDYQKKIIDKLVDHFIIKDKKEGRIVMATGTGKTFTCLEYIRQNLLNLREPKVLIVTNLRGLASQTYETFVSELLNDVLLISLDGTTDPERIKNSTEKVHISTYHSMKIPLSVCKYNMVIFDESHHSESEIRKNIINKISSKILFMTATEKEFPEAELITKYSIGDGIRDGYLSDYRICIFGCSVNPLEDVNVQKYGSIISGLIDKINSEDAFKIVVYCQDQSSAKLFYKILKKESDKIENKDLYLHLLISDTSSYDSKSRRDMEKKFVKADIGIIVNVNIMVEGIDIPEIDTIVFADNRVNKIAILQSIGRALRISPGKKLSTIYMAIVLSDQSKSGIELLEKQHKKIYNIFKYLAMEDDTWISMTDDVIEQFMIKYVEISQPKTRSALAKKPLRISIPRKNGTVRELTFYPVKIEIYNRHLEKISPEDSKIKTSQSSGSGDLAALFNPSNSEKDEYLVTKWNSTSNKTKFLSELKDRDKKWSFYYKIWNWVLDNKIFPYCFEPKPYVEIYQQEEYDMSISKAKKYSLKLEKIINEKTLFNKAFIDGISNLIIHQHPKIWKNILLNGQTPELRKTSRYQIILLNLLENSAWIRGDSNKAPSSGIDDLSVFLPRDFIYLGDPQICRNLYLKTIYNFLTKTFQSLSNETIEKIKKIGVKDYSKHGLPQLLKILEFEKDLSKVWAIYHFVPDFPKEAMTFYKDYLDGIGCEILYLPPWR